MIVRIPKNKCLGYILDRIAKTQVGGAALFGKLLLLRHVHANTDQVRFVGARIGLHLRTDPQPHPGPINVAHPPLAIHIALARIKQAFCKVI